MWWDLPPTPHLPECMSRSYVYGCAGGVARFRSPGKNLKYEDAEKIPQVNFEIITNIKPQLALPITQKVGEHNTPAIARDASNDSNDSNASAAVNVNLSETTS